MLQVKEDTGGDKYINIPDLRTWAWSCDLWDEPPKHKKSYEDIKQDINPKYRKQLERKIIKNMNHTGR